MKNFPALASLCAFLLFLCAAPVSGADVPAVDDQEPVSLGELLITPRRVPGQGVSESDFPGNVSVIKEERIRASGAETVTDLLAQLEGVSLLDSAGSGLGVDSGLNIRGFANSSRTNALVLVNGIRQNRITGDEVHWLSIPVEQIERIEVIRGGAGTIYGEGALSGVINVITKRGGDKPIQFQGSAEVGSYLHRRITSVARGTEGKFSYSAGVTRQETGGYRNRVISRGTTVNLFGGWEPTPDTRLEFTASDHQDTTGFAGGITKETVEKNRKQEGSFAGFFDDHQDSASAQWTQRIGEAWTAVGNLFVNDRESDSVVTSRFANIAKTLGGGVRVGHEAKGSAWELSSIAGVDAAKDKAVTGSRTGSKSESNRTAYGIYLEEALRLFERLTITMGFRFDKSRYEESLTFPTFDGTLRFEGRSPKVGVNYRIHDSASIYASAARAFKAPNIDDLDAVLPPFNDSVDVKPQLADHYEVGVRWQAAPWAVIKAAGFFIHAKDEILFNFFTFENSNFTTRRKGMELSVSGDWKEKGVSYYSTYTLMEAQFHKGIFTGYEIPAVPRHRVTAGVRFPIVKNLAGDLDLLWVGDQFRINDFNNRFPADIYGVVNGTLEYRLPKNTRVYCTVLNLLDEEYETAPSSIATAVSTGENPAAPRTWLIGISWDL
ncbi:MAG: TonB-dependent receptor [Candidatus Omnitrophica bacterium]|nr:TonB-dependent receptor [Candidatus Omnitrophota bacterium]